MCSFLRSVKSVVSNLSIHGCPVSKVWLLLSASHSLLSLCVIAPSPPSASQYMLVSWQLFYVLRFVVNLSDLSLESELLRRKARIPQIQVPSVCLWERLLKSNCSEARWVAWQELGWRILVCAFSWVHLSSICQGKQC